LDTDCFSQEVIEVTQREEGWRLDVFLKEKLKGKVSRSMIQRGIKEGLVMVDGTIKKPSYRLKPGEQITMMIPTPKPTEVLPEAIELHILYEDHDIIVVNKPAGMLTHPTPSKTSGTLVNALLNHCDDLQGIGGEIRPGIVHRLDKETSGVIVIAKNDLSHRSLSSQFKARTVHKEYLAIASGYISKDSWEVSVGLKRHPVQRLKMMADRSGKAAVTLFKVLKRFEGMATLVLATPKTGRTHQIRVHLKAFGHPILGDPLYSRRGQIPSGLNVQRLMLHALKIEFVHPRTGNRISFVAPPPMDFKETLVKLWSLAKHMTRGYLPPGSE